MKRFSTLIKRMEEVAMTDFRLSGVATVLCLGLLFPSIPFSAGQDVPAASTAPAVENTSKSESPESMIIKLSVNEVRLDAVVLDILRHVYARIPPSLRSPCSSLLPPLVYGEHLGLSFPPLPCAHQATLAGPVTKQGRIRKPAPALFICG